MLIEMLIYMSVLLVVMAVGYAAFYRCLDRSTALRRSADDIAHTLQAGERWRADVRAALRPIQLETNAAEQILQLPGPRGGISYRFATNTVFRRVGDNAWSRVLGNVEASSFQPDPRGNVEAWRWELELQTRAKRISRIRPLFTFLAVPNGDSTK